MIVYQSSKSAFCTDVATGHIDQIILERMRGRLGRGAGAAEVRSWHLPRAVDEGVREWLGRRSRRATSRR